jgi:hypothetical protein
MGNNQVPSLLPDKRVAVDAFRKKLAAQAAGVAPGQRPRLIFGIDCTESRRAVWARAAEIQVQMFQEVAKIGGLEIQLAHYRGYEFAVCDWVSDGPALAEKMTAIDCRSGLTQIERLLTHAQHENARRKVQALVFVGDSVEEQENTLFAIARELGLPVFVFQEGDDPIVSRVFGEIARLTMGAHCNFTRALITAQCPARSACGCPRPATP